MENFSNSKTKDLTPQKKIYQAGIIDLEELKKAQIKDVADARMTESKEDRSKNWFTRNAKRFWKHNVAQEWYRNREKERVSKEISESDNLYAGETNETSIKDYEKAKTAILERFTSEYEDDMLKQEEKDSKKYVTDEKVKGDIKNLIKQFAGDLAMSDSAFEEESNRILATSNPEYAKKGKMYANSLLDIAREHRNSVSHDEKLLEMDFDVQIILGQAKESLNTEAKHNAFESIIEKTQNSKIGKYLFNEPASVAIVAGLYSAGTFLGVKMLRSKLMKWGTFGATAILAGGISASKEATRLNRERAQHIRESAKGMEFKENDMKRRKEMEENRYETKNASEIIQNLEKDLSRIETGNMNESELDAILANLSDVEARIKLGDTEHVDLIAYSRFEKVEEENDKLRSCKAKIKVAIRKGIDNGGIKFEKEDSFDKYLQKLINLQSEGINTDIEEKNEIFKTMKRKKVAYAFVKTALIGATAGFIFQEGRAFFNGTDNFFEGITKHLRGDQGHLSSKTTALEGFRRWITGDEPRLPFGTGHEMILGNTHMQLPDGITMNPNPDGTYDILRDDEIISNNVKIGFTPTGDLTDASKELLAKDNILTTFAQTGGKITEHVTRSAEEYTNKHPELTKQIHRSWMDNDTPMEPDPVNPGKLIGAEGNELKLEWGGTNGSGINENGDFVFQVKHMTDDGSFHDGLSVAAREQMKKGGLEILLSVTKGTQHMVIPVTINELGEATILHTSDTGKMLFENVNGRAIYDGAFAEVGYSTGIAPDGGEDTQILASHIGKGVPKDIIEDIIKDTTTPNVKLDVPADWDYEVPFPIPIGARRPLERGEYGEREKEQEVPVFTYYMDYYGSGGGGSPEREKELYKLFEERKSATLKENPNAKLDQYKEIESYFNKMDKNYLERITKLSQQTDKMDNNCKLSVCIPVAGHQESTNIYEALKNYTYQTAQKDNFEIVLFVNHPETDKDGKILDAKDTLEEIERFKKDNPEIKTRVIYSVLPRSESKIGFIRKLMSDATLIRQHERGETAPDLIMVSNDADNKGIDPRYIQSFINNFEKNTEADAFLGQLDWDPESYQKYPSVHIGTRLFQYLNIISRHKTNRMSSSGANSAYRSSIYAGIGGYLDDATGGEDINIGKAIIAARGDVKHLAFAGTETRLFTSSRRAIVALLENGIPPVDQWRGGFSADDDAIRKLEMKNSEMIDYDNPEKIKEVKKELESVINKTIDLYEQGEKLGKGSRYYRRPLRWMGIKYDINSKGDIEISDMDSLVKNLKRYQVQGKLMRDARSGKTEAINELKSLRENEKENNLKEKKDEENKKMNVEEMERVIENFIDELPNNKEKINALNKILMKSLNNDILKQLGLNITIDEIKRGLENCKKIESGADFIREVKNILNPISLAMGNQPEEFAVFKRKAFNESHNFIPLNEVFSYRIDEGDLHVHMAPATDLSAIKKVRLIKDAIEKLPAIVKSNKKVKKISATSPIVASNPGLLEKIGFKNEGPISEEARKRDFGDTTEPISRATISREEFLSKYSKEQDGFIKKLMRFWNRNSNK